MTRPRHRPAPADPCSGMDALDWVPPGLEPDYWVRECRRMAEACREVRPDLSEHWLRRAEAVEREMND